MSGRFAGDQPRPGDAGASTPSLSTAALRPVKKYTAFLEEQFEAHMALSQYFTPSGEVELTPEQLQTLRTLGYIN